jgi:hypothetical protein
MIWMYDSQSFVVFLHLSQIQPIDVYIYNVNIYIHFNIIFNIFVKYSILNLILPSCVIPIIISLKWIKDMTQLIGEDG